MGIEQGCAELVQCCGAHEEEERCSKALLRQLRLNVAGKKDQEKYNELLLRHAEAEKLSDEKLAQVSALKTQREKSKSPNKISPNMLMPTAISSERRYERQVERKYGKKKVTPTFSTMAQLSAEILDTSIPHVEEVNEIDYMVFKKSKK